MPQLAGRVSRKKSEPAEEARDNCFRVREEIPSLSAHRRQNTA